MITAYSYKNILFHTTTKIHNIFVLSQTTNNDLRHEIKKENFEYKNEIKLKVLNLKMFLFIWWEKF